MDVVNDLYVYGKISSLFMYKGSVHDSYDLSEIEDPNIGDIYMVEHTDDIYCYIGCSNWALLNGFDSLDNKAESKFKIRHHCKTCGGVLKVASIFAEPEPVCPWCGSFNNIRVFEEDPDYQLI